MKEEDLVEVLLQEIEDDEIEKGDAIMRYSEMFLPTVREVPSDAEVISHQLMIRAGMIRKLTTGIYSVLPLGYRTVKKVEQIIREEMDAAGAQEVYLPAVQPAELWEESGRWKFYGKELLRFKDRHNRECCIGPTHEEVITDLVRNEIKTYRQLPRNLYQIQTKFRDEVRPRFGVMRCREFDMKDAYSFDADEQGADVSYEKMFKAYTRIFSRVGLNFRPVEADSGNIGGAYSHEFMVLADTGEDALAFCSACEYAANLEKAEIAKPVKLQIDPSQFKALETIHTPNVRTIEEVSAFLGVSPQDIVKTLIFVADGKPVAVLIRGDEEVNEAKLRNFLGADSVELATDDIVLEATNSPKGFAGAIGIKADVYADYSLMNRINVVMGANREDYHVKNANLGRDYCREGLCGPQDHQGVRQLPPLRKAGALCTRDRGGARLQAGHEVQQGHEGHLPGPRRQGEVHDHGLLRNRRGPHRGGRHRAAARRSGHPLAHDHRAVPRDHHSRERQGPKHCEGGRGTLPGA